MHKTDAPNNVANEFSDGTIPLTPGTSLGAKWHNAVQRELVNVVENAGPGAVLNDADDGQVLTALEATFGQLAAANTWAANQTFSGDLQVDGTVTVDGDINGNGTTTLQTTNAGVTQVSTLHSFGAATIDGTLTAGANVPMTGSNPSSSTAFANTLTKKNLCKAWGVGVSDGLGGGNASVSLADGFNITSITVNGNAMRVTLAQAMANTNYMVVATPTASFLPVVAVVSTTVFDIQVRDDAFVITAVDALAQRLHFMVMGAQ